MKQRGGIQGPPEHQRVPQGSASSKRTLATPVGRVAATQQASLMVARGSPAGDGVRCQVMPGVEGQEPGHQPRLGEPPPAAPQACRDVPYTECA